MRPHLSMPALFILGALCLAQPANGAAPEDIPVARPAADLQWKDFDPEGAPGVKVALLWGDMTKGPFGAFLELPAGFAAPLHTHTNAMKLVIVSGTYLQAPKGQPEFRLGPGSYLLQPGGGYQHTTGCDPAAPCVFFLQGEGGFDMHPVSKQAP